MARFARLPLVVLICSLGSLLAPAAASAADCGIPGAPDASFTNTALDTVGSISQAKAGGYLQIPFEVPAGTTAIRVRYSYDQPGGCVGSSPNTLDMGVYEPRDSGETVFGADESRGWSGSAVKDLAIAVNGFTSDAVYNPARKAFVHGKTTRAYRPGPIPTGTWAVELGIAYVDPSDVDGISYHVRVETSTDGDWSDSPYTPSGYSAAAANGQAGWYAGDLHVHGEQEPGNATVTQTLKRAFDPPSAGGSGLDFVTLVDHNNQIQHDDLASYQAANPGKLVIPGTEMTTYEGHYNNQGKAPFVDFRTGPIYQPTSPPPYATIPDPTIGQVRGEVPPSQAFAQIQANGNWTQINHPSIFKTAPSLCRGCAWSYSDSETDFSEVDAIEVQTGPAAIPQPVPTAPNPFTPDAIAFYESALAAGNHIAAVGSSDDHQGGGATGPTDSPVGSATTMVYASELSEQAITDGVKGDHTYVKLFGNSGPSVTLTASSPGVADAIIGDTIAASDATLTATVGGAAGTGRSGSWSLILLKDGVRVDTVPFTGDSTTHAFTASGPGRYSIEVVRTDVAVDYVEVFTSPIWVTASAKPSNDFEIKKFKRNKKKGNGKLSVQVPGAGLVKLTGKGLKKAKKNASGATTLKLPVKAGSKKLKRKLDEKGKAKVKVEVTYTPDGGDPATQKTKLKLLRK